MVAKNFKNWLVFVKQWRTIICDRYEKIDHLQKLLNSRYRLTKSGYGEIVVFINFLFLPA